jgi:lysozyme
MGLQPDNFEITPSAWCDGMVRRFDACHREATRDELGRWVIGWKHYQGVYEGQTCTNLEAKSWVLIDLADAWQRAALFLRVPLSQAPADAVTDFAWSVGTVNFLNSRVLALLNMGFLSEAASAMQSYVHINGVCDVGLTQRRKIAAERMLMRI